MKLSFSRYSQFVQCPRLYRLQQSKAVPFEDKHYFQLGTQVHAGLEYAMKHWDKADDTLADKAAKFIEPYQNDFDTLEQAQGLLGLYIPSLQRRPIKPYIHNGKPLIEYNFVRKGIPITPNHSLSGIVDVVLEADDGRVIVVDWKTQSSQQESIYTEIDAQLYLYVAAMKAIGVPVTHAAQVRLVTDAPSFPEFTKKNRLNKRVGTTTLKTYYAACAMNGLEPNDEDIQWLIDNDKIIDPNQRLTIEYIDLDKVPYMVSNFDRVATAIEAGVNYGLHNSYACKGCEAIEVCNSRVKL